MTLKSACALLSLSCLGIGSLPAAALAPARIEARPARPSAAAEKSLNSLLFDYRVFDLPLARIDRLVRSRGALGLDFGADSFTLRLRPNDLRGEGYRAVLMDRGRMVELKPPPLATFAGEVVDRPRSVVRLTALPDRFEATMRTAETWWFIDPLARYDAKAAVTQVVIYRQQDVKAAALGRCGSERSEPSADWHSWRAPQAKAAPRRSVLNLATDGDGELVKRYGSAGALARIQTIVNNVDGIYQSDLGLTVKIVFQVLWANPDTDPYSSLLADVRGGQFQSYWKNAFGWVSRDNAHLFTGVKLADYIGFALGIGVVCGAPLTQSYELSEDRPSGFELTQLAAHEMGHALGAYHDNDEKICTRDYCGNLCQPALCGLSVGATGPIMCSPLQTNGTNHLSSCSVASIKKGSPCFLIGI